MFRGINSDLNNILGGLFSEMENAVKNQGAQLLTADIKETNTSFIVYSDVPGIKKEDIKITFEDGVLKIETPERDLDKLEEGEKFLLTQRQVLKKVGHFKFKQTVDQESIKALYRDGVLSVEVQKKEKGNVKTVIVD